MSLLQLDASLRSSSPAPAVAKLAQLLSDPASPPALANTCAVKLADAFADSGQVLRQLIVARLRHASVRPSRILNGELVLRRVGEVLAAPDPAARTLALQALGCLARLIQEQAEVVHRVAASLESADDDERAAAAGCLDAACEAGSACAQRLLATQLLPALASQQARRRQLRMPKLFGSFACFGSKRS